MTEIDTNVNTCYRHPDRETGLRCNRCDRYICAQCAVLTPTGYRCKSCIKEQSKVFDTARWYDYPLGIGVALFLGFIGGILLKLLLGVGFFFIYLIFFLAPAAGALIAEAVRFVVRKRRNRTLFLLAAAGVALGGVLANAEILLFTISTGDPRYLVSLLWPLIYIVLATPATYVRLAGIQLNR